MAGEWREVRLAEVAEIIMGQSPPGETYNEQGDGLPFFQGVADFNYRHPTPRVFCSSPSRVARAGDILLSVRAPIGRVNVADRECAIGRGLAIIRPKELDNARYVEFALRHLEPYWHTLEGTGSVFGNATRTDLERLRLPWPPQPERRAIAHILGTLDDKIELNRRMSETLEQMARALFKAWFVDFEPVRAKMEGRWQRGQSLPGLPAHLYDLFPDRLVDSELGEIPEGWEAGRLGDYCLNFDSRRVPLSGRDRANRKGPFPYYGAAGVMDYVDDYLFDGIYLLVGEDGSVMREDGLGVTQYVWGKFWVNNHAHVLQGKPPVSTEQLYLYFAFESVAPYVTGAVQPKLSQDRMNTMPFLFAGEEVCLEFHRLVEPWFAKVRACAEESRTLAALRDALLPKLISGDLQVKDAERFLNCRGES